MANFTGRTPSKFLRVIIGDSSNVLREVPVMKIGNVGLTYPEVDLSALQDALHGFEAGLPDFSLDIGGPFDTSAAAAISASGVKPVLSGSHTVLQPLNGGLVPRSFGVMVGLQQYWTTGDPGFTCSQSATSGILVFNYQLVQNGDALEYTAKIRMFPGSTAMAWGTALPT